MKIFLVSTVQFYHALVVKDTASSLVRLQSHNLFIKIVCAQKIMRYNLFPAMCTAYIAYSEELLHLLFEGAIRN